METDEIEVRDTAHSCEVVLAVFLGCMIVVWTAIGFGVYYLIKLLAAMGHS